MSDYSQKKIVRTTLAIPDELLAATDRAVQEGKAKSRNEFVAIALRHELAALKRAEIDAAFALMSDDEQYKSVAIAIANEFSTTDWEAFKLSEESNEEKYTTRVSTLRKAQNRLEIDQ